MGSLHGAKGQSGLKACAARQVEADAPLLLSSEHDRCQRPDVMGEQ